MPSCLSMSAWSSRASASRRARSSGLTANGFGAADGDGEGTSAGTAVAKSNQAAIVTR